MKELTDKDIKDLIESGKKIYSGIRGDEYIKAVNDHTELKKRLMPLIIDEIENLQTKLSLLRKLRR